MQSLSVVDVRSFVIRTTARHEKVVINAASLPTTTKSNGDETPMLHTTHTDTRTYTYTHTV